MSEGTTKEPYANDPLADNPDDPDVIGQSDPTSDPPPVGGGEDTPTPKMPGDGASDPPPTGGGA